jgi:hypothetical protein
MGHQRAHGLVEALCFDRTFLREFYESGHGLLIAVCESQRLMRWDVSEAVIGSAAINA